MKRAVLMSIQPRWCEKILRGEKTVEVRKTRPTLMQTPFKVYVYCTKPRFEHEDFFALVGKQGFYGGGKIIGEFVCGRIDRMVHVGYTGDKERPKYRIVDDWQKVHDISRLLEAACLTEEELETYLKGKTGFGWHISDLKIYSQPVDITNFHSCLGCEYVGDCDTYCWDPVQIQPQSWRYVEKTKECWANANEPNRA